MTDLCQCPFCGSAPRVYQTEYRIMCSSQSCPVRPSVFSNDLNVAEVRWNSRPEINLMGIPVVVDPSLPPGTIKFVNPDTEEVQGEITNVD